METHAKTMPSIAREAVNYEYTSVRSHKTMSRDLEELNALGKQGYMLVHVTDYGEFVLMREVPREQGCGAKVL